MTGVKNTVTHAVSAGVDKAKSVASSAKKKVLGWIGL